ncbi:hypothetical protein ACIO3O_37280 [Streptomyces sp. NPDC087440]|uniref:hypothetical protein n=1 Tax=Streptomyces sp. NPDC087440 TaxID=3365790 RepID=UPI00382C610D
MTTKKTPTSTDSDALPEAATEPAAHTPTARSAASTSAAQQTVVLSHHLRINGVDCPPGTSVQVSPDYARRLRMQGYTART